MSTLRARGRMCLVSLLVLMLAVTLGGTGGSSDTGRNPTGAVRPAAAAATVTFADEFNKPAGTPVDASKWNFFVGDNVANHERQYYTSSTRNAVHDGNGHLVITAREENPGNYQCWYGRCSHTSARLNTAGKFTQAYGHFEARMKLPYGQGIWPAFWMLGNDIGSVGWPDSGEIDIMELVGHQMSTVYGTLHGPGYAGANSIGGSYTLPGGEWFSDEFHVFAIDWAPNRITWSVDGNVYNTLTPDDLGGREWVFDHPFYLILNLAVGGYWPGDPDASTVFPQRLVVDYVRVTTGGGASGSTGEITGLDGKCVDVAGANTADGTPVQLWDCNGTAAQRWTVASDGTIRALGKCLDVAAAGTASGTKVQLWQCNGTAAQQWVVTDARDIVNPNANKCLDVTGWDSSNGTRLQIWTCTGGANQKWNAP